MSLYCKATAALPTFGKRSFGKGQPVINDLE